MNPSRSPLERLYLGVDGGQTSTTAVIGDATGRVLARGQGGPSNHVKASEGKARLASAVTTALAAACAELKHPTGPIEFDAACLGFTGGIVDKEEVLRTIIPSRRLLVTDDVTIALAGAHPNGTGIVTIAGTGSVCMGRNSSGETARAGGWGYAFGDDGGAWGIVREALRAAFRSQEGWGPATALHQLFLRQSGDTDIHVFRRRLYTEDYSRPRIAAFSQLVAEAADQGDLVARDILQQAAASLATLTNVVRDRLFAPTENVDVAYVGGVFANATVLDGFRLRVGQLGPFRLLEPVHDPACGALLEAIRLGQSS